jgi:type IV pilus assembly protein PilO
MNLNVSGMPWYAQVGLFLALSAAAVGLFSYSYAGPAWQDIAERRARLTALRGDITKGVATARQLPEFTRQVTELEARLETLKAVLPEEKEYGDILLRIHTLATQSSLSIRNFKPAPMVNNPLHAEWPIHLELDGTYHNLGLFFDRISKFPRIINIDGLTIKAKEGDNASTITAECVATTFVLLSEDNAAQAQPPPRQGQR